MIPASIAFVFGVAFIMQTISFHLFGRIMPDVMLLASIYCGFKFMKVRGYQVGLLAGLIQDSFTFGLLGINMLSKGLVGFTTGWLRENHIIDSHSPVTWAIVIFAGSMTNDLILKFYFIGFFDTQFYFIETIVDIMAKGTINILIGVPLFSLLDKMQVVIKQMMGHREF